jgi:hypothetical protein
VEAYPQIELQPKRAIPTAQHTASGSALYPSPRLRQLVLRQPPSPQHSPRRTTPSLGGCSNRSGRRFSFFVAIFGARPAVSQRLSLLISHLGKSRLIARDPHHPNVPFAALRPVALAILPSLSCRCLHPQCHKCSSSSSAASDMASPSADSLVDPAGGRPKGSSDGRTPPRQACIECRRRVCPSSSGLCCLLMEL